MSMGERIFPPQEKMGESARQHVVANYTWNHYKQAVVALYNDLASQSNCNRGKARCS